MRRAKVYAYIAIIALETQGGIALSSRSRTLFLRAGNLLLQCLKILAIQQCLFHRSVYVDGVKGGERRLVSQFKFLIKRQSDGSRQCELVFFELVQRSDQRLLK